MTFFNANAFFHQGWSDEMCLIFSKTRETACTLENTDPKKTINSLTDWNWIRLDLRVDVRLLEADPVLAVHEVLGQVGLRGSNLFEEAIAGQDEQRDDVLPPLHGYYMQLRQGVYLRKNLASVNFRVTLI